MNVLKSWLMLVMILNFVLLYMGALLGWLKPLNDITLVTHLEPILFIIIGYYFGRLPSEQNEQTLKEEIIRQTNKADAAQHSRETAQQEREVFEEKLKNVRAVLIPAASKNVPETTAAAGNSFKANGENNPMVLQQLIKSVANILNS